MRCLLVANGQPTVANYLRRHDDVYLPFTKSTDFTAHNHTPIPVAIATFTRTSRSNDMSFQAYLDKIEDKTGLAPIEPVEMARSRGYGNATKAQVIIDWLKADYDLGRGHAMALVHVIKNGPTISDTHTSTATASTATSPPNWTYAPSGTASTESVDHTAARAARRSGRQPDPASAHTDHATKEPALSHRTYPQDVYEGEHGEVSATSTAPSQSSSTSCPAKSDSSMALSG